MFLEDLNSLRTHDKIHKSLGGICVGAALDDRQRIKDGAIIPVGGRGDRDLDPARLARRSHRQCRRQLPPGPRSRGPGAHFHRRPVVTQPLARAACCEVIAERTGPRGRSWDLRWRSSSRWAFQGRKMTAIGARSRWGPRGPESCARSLFGLPDRSDSLPEARPFPSLPHWRKHPPAPPLRFASLFRPKTQT